MEKKNELMENVVCTKEEIEDFISMCEKNMKEQYESVFRYVPNCVLNEFSFIEKMTRINNYGYVYFYITKIQN